MALDAGTLAQIRDWVGSAPDDVTVEATFNRDDVGTVHLAALKILQQRRADFEANYSEYAVEGDARWKADKNIDALNRRIAELEVLTGSGAGVLTTGQLVRARGR